MTEGVWCFIICFGAVTSTSEVGKGPIDTFCHSYRQVVLKKEDVKEVMKLSRELRARLQGNELEYLCRCQGWRDKACQGLGSTKQ